MRILETEPAARQILGVAAYVAARRIPVGLLTIGETDGTRSKSAIDALLAAGLAETDRLENGEEAISVSPHVQGAMRARHAASRESADYIKQAMRNLLSAYPAGAEPGEVANWPLCERLNQHAAAVLSHAPDEGEGAAETSDLLHRLSHYLFARSRYAEAEPVVRRSGAIDELLYGPNHEQVGQDQANLAILLHEMDRDRDALPHIRRAMQIGEANFGPEHPIVAERYGILAHLLEETGRPAEADPYIRHALLAAEITLGRDHPDTQTYRKSYERIVSAVDTLAQRDDAVEAGLVPAPPERLARQDLPPPGPKKRQRGVLGGLLRGKR